VFTKSPVSNNDLIDGRRVISSESMIGLDGTTQWYEVYLI
jgi:hypothetical protein